jgi:cell wall-associated NlpC family hydrolase
LNRHQLRWALLCVAATPGLLLARTAEASRTVVIERGDSIDSLARKYHVSTRDIAKANHVSVDATLIDGKKLVIPDPPKSVVKAPTMYRAGFINGDRITVRIGPNESYRRLTLLDHGASVAVTRRAGEWYQIKLDSGKIGWIRNDFLALGKTIAEPKVVAHHKASSHTAKRVARKSADDEEDRPVTKKRSRKHKSSDDEDAQPKKSKHKVQVAAHSSKRKRGQFEVSTKRRSRSHSGRAESDAPDADSDIVRSAYAYRGVPYHFGGTSRSGFDCSGFTSYLYHKKGVNLPRTAAEQYGRGQKVHSGEMKPGDLVFFHTTRRGVSHVGMYAGKGKFIHASSGGGRVRVDSLESGYYKQRLVGARRVK